MDGSSESLLFIQRDKSEGGAFSVTVGSATRPKKFEGFTRDLLIQALEKCQADYLIQVPKDSYLLKAASEGAHVPFATVYVGGDGPAGRISHLDQLSDSWGFIARCSTTEAEESLARILGREASPLA